MTYSWKNVVITEQQSIRDALRLIDQEALRVGLVVNDQNKLLGVITDGDVRRGLIAGLNLSESVSKIMNKHPIVESIHTDKSTLIKLMEDEQILSIPLIDNEGCLVGLQTLQGSLLGSKYDNPVFIMAGGFGTRLRPLTDNCPKPMLKVGGRPMLETLILNFKKAGFHDFYVSTHYLPDVIHNHFGDGSEYGVSINYVHEENPLGTGGAIGLLPDSISNLPIIIINGDVLTTIDFEKLLSFHNENNAAATMCVREFEYQVPYGVIESEGSKIVSMDEKPIHRFFINAGIYVIGKEVCSRVKVNVHLDMPDLLQQGIELGSSILKYPVHEYWLDIGRMSDFEKAQIDIHDLGL